MGRHAEGLKYVVRRGYGYARFTWQGQPHLISTGQRDSPAARAEAERIYALTITGKRPKAISARSVASPLVDICSEWLASLEGSLDPSTIKTYELYVTKHFMPFFSTMDKICDPKMLEKYMDHRLKNATRKTLCKELGALHKLTRWAVLEDIIDEAPKWPDLPKSRGVRVGPQRMKAPQYSVDQIERALAALPEYGRKGIVVRDRFVFAYETGLRPSTIDKLSIPEHWDGESETITITDNIDKAKMGRVLDITTRARDALKRAAIKAKRPIFGKHDYRPQLLKAARAAGIPSLSPYDFRHNRGTHLVDAGAPLTGVAYMYGHTQITTTAKYVKGNRDAAKEAINVTRK